MSSVLIKILILDKFEILGKIYDRFWTVFGTTFGTVFLVLFADCIKLFFYKKVFKIFYLCFLSEYKTAELVLQEIACLRSRKTLSFEWPNFDLKYILTVMPKSSKLVYKNFLFLKQAVSVPADGNWVVIMELKREGGVQLGMYFLI